MGNFSDKIDCRIWKKRQGRNNQTQDFCHFAANKGRVLSDVLIRLIYSDQDLRRFAKDLWDLLPSATFTCCLCVAETTLPILFCSTCLDLVSDSCHPRFALLQICCGDLLCGRASEGTACLAAIQRTKNYSCNSSLELLLPLAEGIPSLHVSLSCLFS